MKTLDDIRQDKDIQSQIHWDMKPRERVQRVKRETEEDMAQVRKLLEARVGYYFYIDVMNHYPGLYLYENYPDGSGKFIAEITEIPEEMIHGAIQEAGGSLNVNGRYPINAAMKDWLKNRLA